MPKINCWEFKQCGREPGGANTQALGVCPAALPSAYDGANRGLHGGRFCWAVAGTLCGGRVQGTFAKKFKTCLDCEFLKHVQEVRGRFFILLPEIALAESESEGGTPNP